MSTELVIRPARPDDRPAMERICAQIWDGHDYVPAVWDQWLTDTQGPLIVGEAAGQVVALSKTSFLAPGEAWLQGMRVDPEFHRQGIAARFLEYSLTDARERGAHVVRLSTGSYNTPVHIIAARLGMERIGIYVFWVAEPLPDGPELAILSEGDQARVDAFLRASAVFEFCHGVYVSDWAWRDLSPEELAHLLQNGRVLALQTPQGLLEALSLVNYDAEDEALGVGLAAGEPSAVSRLAIAIRAHASRMRAKNVRAWLPELTWLRNAFASAGYGFGEWQAEMWLFERRFPPGEGEAHAI